MARIAANPRIDPDVLTRGVWELMADAMDVSYLEFERRALTFEALADPVGAAEKTERNRLRRTASIHRQSDGSWSVNAKLDDVGGPELLEIFCWYVDREFTNDWSDATRRLGDGNVDVTNLRRTEAQRRADALLEMARAAACPPDRQRPRPTVNFLLDEVTARAVADATTPTAGATPTTSPAGPPADPTNPDNGAPLCARHNHLEETGFTVYRDDDGHWHITGPDGTQIC